MSQGLPVQRTFTFLFPFSWPLGSCSFHSTVLPFPWPQYYSTHKFWRTERIHRWTHYLYYRLCHQHSHEGHNGAHRLWSSLAVAKGDLSGLNPWSFHIRLSSPWYTSLGIPLHIIPWGFTNEWQVWSLVSRCLCLNSRTNRYSNICIVNSFIAAVVTIQQTWKGPESLVRKSGSG